MIAKRTFQVLVAGLFLCFISICLQISLLVSADESSCSAQDRDTGACGSSDPMPSSSSPKESADEVGDRFQQFLNEKIFGQADMKEATGEGFLTHLNGDNGKESGSKGEKEFQGISSVLKTIDKFIHKGAKDTDESHTEKVDNPFHGLMDRIADMMNSDESTGEEKIDKEEPSFKENDEFSSLIAKVKHLNDEDTSIIGFDFLRTMQEAFEKAIGQLHNTFGKILDDVDATVALSSIYFLAHEDSRKNPSWKRQQHRFYDKASKSMVMELHDALYLSQLSYVNSVDDFKEGLTKFQNNEWEMAYGTTDSLPSLPAHFLLIHKRMAPLSNPGLQSILPWERSDDSELTVTLVVRGTKDLSDALADALLEPAEYRDGYAHGGILENGKNLAERYLPKLKSLLQHSNRDKLRLYLVGHSLGAGAAAIAAMEFRQYDWIAVESLGFGCPSLLSHELSEATKDYVTTVVADSDIIPRMSGASMANLLLNLIEFDWTDSALDDLDFTFDRAKGTFPFGNLFPDKGAVLDWAKEHIEKDIKPKVGKEKRERISNVLIPPGICLHFYRDGVGYSGVYTPCSFFDNIDISRTLIDDHLILRGYHRALVSVMRDWENNFNVSQYSCADVWMDLQLCLNVFSANKFDFPHDIVSLDV